jgi:hypothetical protein
MQGVFREDASGYGRVSKMGMVDEGKRDGGKE